MIRCIKKSCIPRSPKTQDANLPYNTKLIRQTSLHNDNALEQ